MMYCAEEPYDHVLRQLKAQLGKPEFFVRLTGKKGSGKSALLEQIVGYYTEQGYLARYFPTSSDSPMALRSALRKSFGLEQAHNFQRSLQEHLVSEALLHKGIVLIFDDCHLMNNATLLELTKLTDIHFNNSGMLCLIMGACDTLDSRLNRDHELRPVLQRITLSTHLKAMDKKACTLFLRAFFDAAGQQDLEIEPAAQTLLYNASKGFPHYLSEVAALCSNLYRTKELSSPVRKSDLAQVLKHPSLAARGLVRNRPALSRSIMVSAAALALMATAWISQLSTAPNDPAALSSIAADATGKKNLAEIADEPVSPADVNDTAQALPRQDSVPASEQTVASPSGLSSPEQTLRNWITAWQSRQLDAYFSFYHSDFFPRGFDSVSAWQENRRRNIGNREWIQMQVSELSTNNIAERVTELQFWLLYQSAAYSDRTHKKIIMRLTDDGWQITEEINLEIIHL
jgi:type II secretory pathway predicted ATPase ExeA